MQVDPNLGQMRIPDILETIADLSNDEVFTPPDLANKVLDMLPSEIWSNSKTTFLDPACKTGVFLREIAKRLIVGLEYEIPDLQERVNHILTKQVYGLAITELTALMSRRTVYCATKANSEASVVTAFDNADGNIKFPKSKHIFNEKTKKCTICGAGEDLYHEIENRDNYAYSFLHDDLKEVFGNVKFDVIIGNPPYQLNVGNEGRNSSKSKSIYHLFIDKALELNPKYISMITPSRWMTNSADGISGDWTKKIISSKKIKYMHDYENGDALFRSVGIAGGISYFLWDNEYDGECYYNYYLKNGTHEKKKVTLNKLNIGFVIRSPKAQEIIDKIIKVEKDFYNNNKNMSFLISPKDFFVSDGKFSSSWRGYSNIEDKEHKIKYYVSESTNKKPFGYAKESDIKRNNHVIFKNKVIIPAAHGGMRQIGHPRYAESGSICSQTYLLIGHELNLTEKECQNLMTYIKTKFFRYLVSIKKKTQNGPRSVYQLVPLQDWSKPWTDAELYKKYKLTEEEIAYIEENIEEMK